MRSDRKQAGLSWLVGATLLAGLALTVDATIAHAQLAWESPAQTFPPSNPRPPVQSRIALWSSPTLVVGAPYAIETIGVTGDPVMTITSQSEPTSTVISGADGLGPCYTGSLVLDRACATFTATTTSPVWAHIRAWITSSGGTVSFRIRRLASAGVVPTDNLACPVGTTVPTTTCWIQDWGVQNQTFGGVVRGIGTLATQYHLVTRETPYYLANVFHAPHTLWFVPSNDLNQSWQIRSARLALPANGVGQTTSYTGPLPSGIPVPSRYPFTGSA